RGEGPEEPARGDQHARGHGRVVRLVEPLRGRVDDQQVAVLRGNVAGVPRLSLDRAARGQREREGLVTVRRIVTSALREGEERRRRTGMEHVQAEVDLELVPVSPPA